MWFLFFLSFSTTQSFGYTKDFQGFIERSQMKKDCVISCAYERSKMERLAALRSRGWDDKKVSGVNSEIDDWMDKCCGRC
jgi:hypothetical protein